MKKNYFITGTDTGVGKTVVTASLMAALQAKTIRCMAVKPVQTGCENGDDDFAWCLSFNELPLTSEQRRALTMHRFAPPMSPHLAARLAGTALTVQSLEKHLSKLSNDWNVLLIEGAGGLLVPLNESETVADLMAATGATPIVVTHSGLGTLNHTALTLNELERRTMRPAALVINDVKPPTHAHDQEIRTDNIRQLSREAGTIPVFTYGYSMSWTKETLARCGNALAETLINT